MIPFKDKLLRLYAHIAFWSYVVVGFLGAALISDDLDDLKFLSVGFIGVPLVTILCLIYRYGQSFMERTPGSYAAIYIFSCVMLLPGFFSSLNAISGEPERVKQSVDYAYRGYVDSKQRGGFGYLYKFRF